MLSQAMIKHPTSMQARSQTFQLKVPAEGGSVMQERFTLFTGFADATKNIWLIPIAIVLMAYANIVLKLRIKTLSADSSVVAVVPLIYGL